MSTEVAKTEATQMALPPDLLAKLAEEAKAEAAKERPSLSKISLRSGIMNIGGQALTGNKVEVVILAMSYRNTYYKERFDPNNIQNPNCFALSETDEDMAPHENVSEPEHPTCSGCPMHEWGSDPGGGRGKACKETRRLILLPVDAVNKGAEAVKVAELAILDIPVTSVKNYSQFINTLSASAGVPAWACIVMISVVPDQKTQFKVMFSPIKVVPTVDLLDSIKIRREDALRIALSPYDETAIASDGKVDETKAVPKKSAKF